MRVLAGRYELRSILGRGGMAQVWSGFDQRLGRDVAVKVLDHAGLRDSTALTRFDREARIVARLSHPNIVAVHDVGAEAGTPFLVMELVPGSSLADLLAAGPVAPSHAVDIAVQVCDALTAAHAAGVVHRDVKPANILLTPTGQVKVCDFGIARVADAEQVHLTASAQAVGTSTYMAPEQITGDPIDARTDLYALGCVLYTMLTGQPPFSGGSSIQVAMQHLQQAPIPPSSRRPGLPPDLDALVAALLAKQPADRPGTAAQVRTALTRLGAGNGLPAGAGSGPGAGSGAGTGAGAGAGLGAGPTPTAMMPVLGAHRPIRASAAVQQPTQTVPVLGRYESPPDEATPSGAGFRIGPGGAALLALAAAAVAVIVFAAVLAGRGDSPSGQTAAPVSGAAVSTGPAVPDTTTSSPVVPSAEALPALKTAIDEQRRAGELDAGTARELTKQVDEISRSINKGDTDKAAEKTAELRKKLGEAREDGKLGEAGYTVLLSATERLAATLPVPDDQD